MDGDTITVAAILAALAPLVIAVINRPAWSATRKQLVAIGASLVVAVVALAVTGELTASGDAAAVVLLVIGTAQAAYALIWKPTGTAPAIERSVRGDYDLAA